VAAEYTVRADTARELVLSAKVYTIETTNQIIAIPRSLVTWSATNIAAVRSRGVELGAIARYQEWLTMRGGVTIQDVRDNARDSRSYGKIIPYVPTTLAYVRCDATHGGVVVGGGLHACGVRYTQTDNVPESALNAYITANANVGYQWRTRAGTWKLRVDCDNLLDAAYSVIANYPMPGRMMRASMEWQW
jgi:outer membrane cobalamin receptor